MENCEECGKEITELEYERNGGRCDDCAMFDDGVAML